MPRNRYAEIIPGIFVRTATPKDPPYLCRDCGCPTKFCECPRCACGARATTYADADCVGDPPRMVPAGPKVCGRCDHA